MISFQESTLGIRLCILHSLGHEIAAGEHDAVSIVTGNFQGLLVSQRLNAVDIAFIALHPQLLHNLAQILAAAIEQYAIGVGCQHLGDLTGEIRITGGVTFLSNNFHFAAVLDQTHNGLGCQLGIFSLSGQSGDLGGTQRFHGLVAVVIEQGGTHSRTECIGQTNVCPNLGSTGTELNDLGFFCDIRSGQNGRRQMRTNNTNNVILFHQAGGALHRSFVVAFVIVLDQFDLLAQDTTAFVDLLNSQLGSSLTGSADRCSRPGQRTVPTKLDGVACGTRASGRVCVTVFFAAGDQTECHNQRKQ